MNEDLQFRRHSGTQEVSVEIAGKQRKLEEEHTGIPNCWCSTQNRQKALTDSWFEQKHGHRRNQNAQGEEEHCSGLGHSMVSPIELIGKDENILNST